MYNHMDKVNLYAKVRQELGKKVNRGRKEGRVPAVIYGNNSSSQNLWVDMLELKRLIKKSGENSLIDLSLEDSGNRNVIIQEMQRDPISGNYIHVDFFEVRMDEKIETEVELSFMGESPAVKEAGGVLVKSVDKLEIKCLPGDIPSDIKVDISRIKTFEDHILVRDLSIPKGVEVALDPETVIALVAPPRSEQEMEALEQKVEADVTKVEGVVKQAETAPEGEEKKE